VNRRLQVLGDRSFSGLHMPVLNQSDVSDLFGDRVLQAEAHDDMRVIEDVNRVGQREQSGVRFGVESS
jgi:hypothetical protein